MRTSVLAAAGLAAVLSAPAAAAGTPGPFAGVVQQGQTRTHAFDNSLGQPCIHLMTWYTVRLAYSPPVDRLTLTVDGVSVNGSNGGAALALYRSYCTTLSISVTGTSVTGPAATYTVTVTRDSAGGGTVANN